VVPGRKVIESLLRAADILSAMVESPSTSESVDIDGALRGLLASTSDPVTPPAEVRVLDAAGRVRMRTATTSLESSRKGGKRLYLLSFDLVADVDARGKTPLDLFRDLDKTGLIVETALDVAEDGRISGSARSLPFHVLYATVLDQEMTALLTGLPVAKVFGLGPESFQDGAATPAQEGAAPRKGRKGKAAASRKVATEAPAPAPVAPVVVLDAPAIPDPQNSPDATAEDARHPAAQMAVPQASTLRVNVKVLDRLMTLAGELVLSRNQLMQKTARRDLAEIQSSAQSLSLIISELQEAVMSTRMQPLSIVFGKFHRVVRDMSGALGKEIRLDVEGEDVELDKTVIESIGDPLTHLVRNAIDHGIEPDPATREKAGKPRQAVVRLHAYHEAGKVVIEVSDDGRGIDTAKVREKALQQGLIDAKQAEQMTQKELVDLIFLPGFSTAAAVTDISGRGVGMDVVKTNFGRLGGVIDIESTKGRGTVFRVKLPLTLAIIPSLLVSVQDETYAIPQASLVELVRIPAKEVRNRIERIGSALVMRLRGRLLPLVKLSDALGVGEKLFRHPETGEWMPDLRAQVEDRRGPLASETRDERARRGGADRRYHSDSAVSIAVLSVGHFQYGLIVDRLHESEEIVVKPLGRHFAGTGCYAGATILGDGRVSLILDVLGLSRQLSLHEVGGAEKNALDDTRGRGHSRDAQALLLFSIAEGEQFAVPLAQVSRIETIPTASIETLGGKRSVQYRGGSLPLVDLAEVARIAPLPAQDAYFVVVFAAGGREVGLLVSSIVDIADASDDFDQHTFCQPGILGSSIIAGHTTLLVDLWGVVQALLPGWIPEREVRAETRGTRILVADDSPFYLAQLTGFLQERGYDVVQAVDGAQAFARLESEAGIALVLTDIEMPVMDGLEFVRRIRFSDRFRHLPVVAVTSLSGDDAVARGKAAGVDAYMVKLDREQIIRTVETFLDHGRH
jgi:two-component system chemotaxis sensor kinase CheA